jgi:glycosyltransferase involved in cell wall biosynthesis
VLARREVPLSRRLVRVIRDGGIDLVHCNNGFQRESVLAALLTGVPCVCHVRRLQRLSTLDRSLARSVDAFVYISSAVRACYLDEGIRQERGVVVHNPIDAEAFGKSDGVAELRSELGLSDQDRVVSNIGRLVAWKGQDDFLHAMAIVVRSVPNVKALIVGAPDLTARSQEYHRRLRELVVELRLSDRVLLTGFRGDIARIMAASDVVVHSASEPEPFGRVIVEAMASGRPVIATAAGGVLDIIEDERNGLLVPPGDATSMAEAILRLLVDRAYAKRIGQQGQQCARERFSVHQHVTAIQRIYQQILPQ